MEVYVKILKKIGEKLTELELESEFIWDENKKTLLKSIIKQLYEQLEEGYICFIKIDEYNCINFSFEEYEEPQIILGGTALSPCNELCAGQDRANKDGWFKLSAKTVNEDRDINLNTKAHNAINFLNNIG